ncbi:MarR family winged helix-turn-helix transcriptional regulator [Oricola sp.]|uniref:MarR family winged helix-turn-helix transcriptional regulator n=1 Tax=Oricola sp. TaxID=1979950 RepID=UPI0025CF6AF2|nr:MarR family winged helix-turn-helix transcriptional regulator [Oricola sp.]MCI5076300.1 MarR family winged helix-turn-helix transcriptional regulator [Oricola sp.]
MSFRLDSFLAYRLDRVSEAVSRHFQPVYRDQHGMTRPEWQVLAHLGEADTLTAREIVRRTGLHKTKVSRAVSALESRRWLERNRDETDRRIEHLALTSKGRKSYDALTDLLKAREEELLKQLGPTELQTVSAALNILEKMSLPKK